MWALFDLMALGSQFIRSPEQNHGSGAVSEALQSLCVSSGTIDPFLGAGPVAKTERILSKIASTNLRK